MAFHLSNEKAIDVLIWWVEGADGSIDYSEEQAVKRVLETMDYSIETFYQETLGHIGALSTEQLYELVDKAIRWGNRHFSTDKKRTVLMLLENVASSNGKITNDQQEKLDRIKEEFGLN